MDNAQPILLSYHHAMSNGEGMRCGGGVALPPTGTIYFMPKSSLTSRTPSKHIIPVCFGTSSLH